MDTVLHHEISTIPQQTSIVKQDYRCNSTCLTSHIHLQLSGNHCIFLCETLCCILMHRLILQVLFPMQPCGYLGQLVTFPCMLCTMQLFLCLSAICYPIWNMFHFHVCSFFPCSICYSVISISQTYFLLLLLSSQTSVPLHRSCS